MSRNRVELMHQIGVLYNWATDQRDTISSMSEKQAGEAVKHLKGFWKVAERRSHGSVNPNR